MSSTHISALPDEVLINIFEYLHGNKRHRSRNLINAASVCTQWNRIISQTHTLLNKLQLHLQSRLLPDALLEEGLTLSRDYRHVACHYQRFKRPSRIFYEVLRFDQLKSLEITHWQPSNAEVIEKLEHLSKCKFLSSLTFKECEITGEGDENIEEIERIEFNSLKKLQLCKTNSFLLNFIKCKELDSFSNGKQYDRKTRNSERQTIAFLNQLDRCDNIFIEFQHWNFDDDFRPKFLWNRLRMLCEMDRYFQPDVDAISSIRRFLEASAINATADITLVVLSSNRFFTTHNNLWLAILNSCRVITKLSLRTSKLPSNLTELRDLSELQILSIDALVLKDVVRFSNFTRKLPNVTKLNFFSNEIYYIDLPADAALRCQPFLNQITELTIDSGVVDSKSWPKKPKREENHLISNLMCENLTLIRINETSKWDGLERQLNELFLRFCKRNKNLRRMKIEIVKEIEDSNVSGVLIGWYNQLRAATNIETCNVIVNRKDQRSPKNWRVAGIDEIQLFGRSLTEDENHFFI